MSHGQVRLAPCRFPVRSSRFRSPGRSGFTLVEVALSIAIAGFAFIAIFGLLPVGLNLFASALDNSVRTQIVQRVTSDVEQTDFDVLAANPTLFRYFDDEGTELPSITKSLYTVKATVLKTPPLPTGNTSNNLLKLTVQIARNPTQIADPFTAPSGKFPIWQDIAYVARSQNQ